MRINLKNELLASDMTEEELSAATGIPLPVLNYIGKSWFYYPERVSAYDKEAIWKALAAGKAASNAKFADLHGRMIEVGLSVTTRRDEGSDDRPYWVCTIRHGNLDSIGVGSSATQWAWSPYRALKLAIDEAASVAYFMERAGIQVEKTANELRSEAGLGDI